MARQQLTPETTQAIILLLEAEKGRIDLYLQQLRGEESNHSTSPAPMAEQPRKFHWSAESRKKASLAQKARWALIKAASAADARILAAPPAKPTRQLSEAGRQNIIAALKKRHRREKAAKRAAAKHMTA